MKSLERRRIAALLLVASVSALGFGLSGSARAGEKTAPSRVLVAREGDSFLEEIDGQRVLHLSGEPFQMGLAHGKLLSKETRQDCDAYLRDFAFGVKHYTLEYLQGIWKKAKPHVPQEYLDEMRGLAEGSGVPLEELEAVHIIPELHHCSGAAVFGKMTKDGKLYHYRSLDYSLSLGSKKKVQENACLIVRKPKKGYATVVVGWAGTLGCVTGMSEQQISIGEMGSGSYLDDPYAGTPMWLRVRWILENAKTLDEGVKGFQDWERTCGYNFIITDGKIPDARAIELDRKRVAVFAPGGAEENVAPHDAIPFCVRRTNHFVDPELASRQRRPYDPRESDEGTWKRYDRLSKDLREREGKLDGEGMIGLCRRYPEDYHCLHQAVFCTSDLRFWVANAKDPATTKLAGAQNQTFFPYDLRDLLATDPTKLAAPGSSPASSPEKKTDEKKPDEKKPDEKKPGEKKPARESGSDETKPDEPLAGMLAGKLDELMGADILPAPDDARLVKLLGGEPTGTASEPALEAKDDDEATATALKRFARPAGKFSYRLVEKDRGKASVTHELRFPSSARTVAESDVVVGHYYEPAKLAEGEKVPGCVVVHHLGGSFAAEEYLANYLAKKGVASVMISLPNYGERKAPGSKEGFITSANPLDALNGMRQAVLDVRRAADVLRAQPCVDKDRVGIAGISLGAIVAADAAGIDTRFARAVLIIGGGDFLKIIKNAPEAKGYVQMIEKLGVKEDALKKGFDLVDPNTFAHRLRSDDVLMLNAEKDEIFPRESTLGLWRRAGYPKIKWYDTGHYGMALKLLEVTGEILDHVKGKAPERDAD